MCGMARDDPEIRLRLPTALKAALEAAAKASGRSVNSYVAGLLHDAMEETPRSWLGYSQQEGGVGLTVNLPVRRWSSDVVSALQQTLMALNEVRDSINMTLDEERDTP